MDKNITIYTSNSCMYCHMAKDYLDEIDVPYEEKNVSNDERARHELAEKGYMGVPVIIIGDEEIVGFDKERIARALGK